MNALSNNAATTLLSAYKPEKSLATEKSSITTKSLTTTVVQYLPSGTTTEYRTTTATVLNGTLTSLTAPATTATATTSPSPSPSSGVGRDAGTRPVEDSLGIPPPAPPARASAASANPAVVGGIIGTFAGLSVIAILIFIMLRRRKRRTRIDDECIRTRMYEIPAYEPKFLATGKL
ncbi:hypothetical protein PG990_002198 [Apiospora arundinis]